MKCSSLVAALVLCSAVPPATAVDDVFDSNGVSIRYVSVGTGDPVVLIHGWMTDSTMWGRDSAGNTRLDPEAAKEFRLIALDCRGHGKSGKPHDPAKYGPELAADVVRLLDHLKIPKAHLVGYSMGAFVAGKVAATHPHRVLSVVYGGQAPILAGRKANPEAVDEVEVFGKAVDEGGDLGAYILATAPPGKPKPTPELARFVAAMLFGGKDVKALAAAGRSFGGLAVTANELKRCPAPVLFVHGGAESEAVTGRVAAVRQALGRGEVTVVPGADHVGTLTRPEFRAAVVGFLRANKQP